MITFSPNVKPELKAAILGRLGLEENVVHHDKYLGLPSFIGKNKRSTFNGIKERDKEAPLGVGC